MTKVKMTRISVAEKRKRHLVPIVKVNRVRLVSMIREVVMVKVEVYLSR